MDSPCRTKETCLAHRRHTIQVIPPYEFNACLNCKPGIEVAQKDAAERPPMCTGAECYNPAMQDRIHCESCKPREPYSNTKIKYIPKIKGKPRPTHCKNGHEYNEKNTRTKPSGYRECRICDRDKSRRRRKRIRERKMGL